MTYTFDAAWGEPGHGCHYNAEREWKNKEKAGRDFMRRKELGTLEAMLAYKPLEEAKVPDAYGHFIVPDDTAKHFDDFVNEATPKSLEERAEIAALRLIEFYNEEEHKDSCNAQRAARILYRAKAGWEKLLDIADGRKAGDKSTAREILRNYEKETAKFRASFGSVIGIIAGTFAGYVSGVWPFDGGEPSGEKCILYTMLGSLAGAAVGGGATLLAHKAYYTCSRAYRKITARWKNAK